MRDAVPVGVTAALLGAGAIAAVAVVRSRSEGAAPATSRDAAAARPAPAMAGGDPGARTDDAARSWVWPLPQWRRYLPQVSSGFGTPRTDDKGQRRQHAGVDIMYRRKTPTDLVQEYPSGSPHGEGPYFMPDAIPVMAVRDGTVWSAGRTKRGLAIVLDHGPPWASFYQHLSELFVGLTQRGQSGQRVRAGDVIGHVGADPLDVRRLLHLHLELWHGGDGRSAIDPEPLMKHWLVVPDTSTVLLPSSLGLLA